MLKQQQDDQRPVSSRHGIHTGSNVTMTWKPAPVDHGIKFVRVDLDSKPEIEPHIRNIGDTTRWTTIGTNGTVIHTVEHVLATLNGYGSTISSSSWMRTSRLSATAAPCRTSNWSSRRASSRRKASARSFGRRKRYNVEVGDSLAVVVPSEHVADQLHDPLRQAGTGCQFLSLAIEPDTFETQISPARTFALYEEVQYLIDHGLIKGGSLENAVLIRNETILATEPLRFRDEFVRHKILDVLGDIVLWDARSQRTSSRFGPAIPVCRTDEGAGQSDGERAARAGGIRSADACGVRRDGPSRT